MAEYTDSVSIAVPPGRLFDYLADVEHLPSYMPRLTTAEEIGDGAVEVTACPILGDGTQVQVTGQAWTRIDKPGRTFSWGSVGGRHAYKGTFDVDPEGEGSRLIVRIRSERAEGDAVRAGLHDTLTKIKTLAES